MAEESGAGEPSVRIRLPDEALRSFVTFYYFVDVPGPLEDFLYPEWGNVRFSLRGDWWVASRNARAVMPPHGALFGPTDRAARVRTHDGVTAGFGLTPLGWEWLIGTPADELANQYVDLGAVLGPPREQVHAALLADPDDAARAALFDRLLLDRLAVNPPNSDEAIAVDAALRRRPADVKAFAAAVGVSPRVLGTICKRVFGFGPKRLLRRNRFLDTLGQIRITDHPQFSALMDPEYFDLAHFNHEFRAFMGLSPTKYLAAPRPLMGQAALVQLQVGIPLSFKLPPPPL